MNTEAMNLAIAELVATAAEAEANGQDATVFYEAADKIHDAIAAAEARIMVIPAGIETYWG